MRIIPLYIISLLFLFSCSSNDDEINNPQSVYPEFGSEIEVVINGLSFDAMEPFISPNGNYLFFNNLNDGINTRLYYATKVNDSTFNLAGELTEANQTTPPHLDAVADMDVNGSFYWTSTRNYPTELNNLFHGTFSSGSIRDIERVQGDFNRNTPGWLIMDHGISLDGQYLYFNNARFDDLNCQGPCETTIGIAQKENGSTFSTLPNSASILQNINDTNYIYYAPCISSDDLELYYTRYLKGEITSSTVFEICVAVRNDPTSEFSIPSVLFSETILNLIEAPTLTVDKNIMYYHQKTADSHKIMMRYRI
ncbi:PD40 domain-containing protein [Maribacter polysiphoniae]|uniref:PD40 domain-containing protein n=1 Tax=Maribacter polysiphoniae TaxID=429344 RepID=A0A316DYP0_9FLAO|nr:PD40 domain-containing protein [Maribacter polysiphoniae]MBD1261532.1 PD40 domain-containing protein [Maribacter polysiphoniae]PWK22866.1 WD40 repeat protein [Maribacter polysiphoniae]